MQTGGLARKLALCKLLDVTKPLTPTELARMVDISVPYASQILSGKRPPSAALARLIEEKAGIPRHTLRPDIFDAPSPVSPATPLAGAPASAPAPAAFCGEGAGGVIGPHALGYRP